MKMKNMLLSSVYFTLFGEASSFCGLITNTWKSALSGIDFFHFSFELKWS